jgi:8-oxo-dGTP diphosphatase
MPPTLGENGLAESKPWGISVRAILEDPQGRWLLIRRSNECRSFAGYWELPGGKMDRGESIDSALRREVREETGLLVEPRAVAGMTERDRENLHVVAIYFTTRLVGGKIALSSEHDEFRWVSVQEMQKMTLDLQLEQFARDRRGQAEFSEAYGNRILDRRPS